MANPYVLYGVPGSGAMIVEAAFNLAEIDVSYKDLSWDDVGWDSKVLANLNPLGQVPTVITPNGTVLTESAAILLHIHDLAPEIGLIPPPDHPRRVEFLRWFVFLVAAVYPTFTYGDVPKRWVDGDDNAGSLLLTGTDEHRKQLFAFLESKVDEPWFLGDSFSALDLYLWLMRWWRPGREWHEANYPRMFAIGKRTEELAQVKAVERRNFPLP